MIVTPSIKGFDMPRNLDMTALRSFVTVAETGGVTRAAGFLNLTQSAVSMQLKRLEESLNMQLLDRSSRAISLTGAGEQMLSYAKRMLALNDEAFARLTHKEYEGEIVLGVPHDIVYPAVPQILNRFHTGFPRVKVQLVSSYTNKLKEMFASGKCDLIVTTENTLDKEGETLVDKRLVWVGAPGGLAWKQRPLRLAFAFNCIFRSSAQSALDAAGIPWEMGVESESSRTIEASVSADLAIHAMIEGTEPPYIEPIPHGGVLPELSTTKINLYRRKDGNAVTEDLAALVRQSYGCL
jgi:DNA-binding transcriptional LysR family regulator